MLLRLDDFNYISWFKSIFSKLDVGSRFHQIELDDESRLISIFMTPFRQYCFKDNHLVFYLYAEISELLGGL